MKSTAAAGLLAVGLIVLAGAIVYTSSGETEDPSGAETRALAGRVAKIEGDFAELKVLLEELSRTNAEAASAASRNAGTSGDLAAAETDAETGADGAKKAVESVETLLTSADPEATNVLREFVRQALQEERQERQDKARRRSQEWQQEMKAMREGPYGKYNFKINSLAKKLDFSDSQKQVLYDSLLWFDEEKGALKKSIQRGNPESAKEYKERKGELSTQFEDSVVRSLDADQAEAWKALPEWERNPSSGGMGLSFTTAIASPMGDGEISGAGVSTIWSSVEGDAGASAPHIQIMTHGIETLPEITAPPPGGSADTSAGTPNPER